jgi:hypothetical protein
MRVSLHAIAVAALLSSVPFASVVRSYPTGGYIDIWETSKRGFGVPKTPSPKNPFATPFDTPSPKNPFATPFDTPSPPSGIGGSAASTWRNFADGELKFGTPAQNAVRAKGQKLIQDLEIAIASQSASKKLEQMSDNSYKGQGGLYQPPVLGTHQNAKPYHEFGIDVSRNWRGDEIIKGKSGIIVKTYESPKQKAMIISLSDNRAQDPKGKMNWSDMIMSNWQEAAKAEKTAVSDLQYIIRNNIQPKTTETKDKITGVEETLFLETQPAMNGVFAAMGKSKEETLTLDFKTTNKVELQQISILSAQTHVARVLQLLKDYRGEFKDLTITKLHLQHRDNKNSDSQYNIIIELGR